jgi:hypothetical protein
LLFGDGPSETERVLHIELVETKLRGSVLCPALEALRATKEGVGIGTRIVRLVAA